MSVFKFVAIAIVLIILSGCMPHIIDDGEVGVVKSWGEIKLQELDRGFTLGFPFFRHISTESVRLVELTETFAVPTRDGMIVDMDATLLANRKPDQVAEQAIKIHGNPWNTVVLPQFRSAIRESVATYPIEQVYQGEGRLQIALRTADKLRFVLEPHGFVVDSVLLRDVRLPDAFKDAVSAKLTAEQQVQQKSFELEKAEKDAEIEVARATGAMQAQQIIQSTLTENYLRYLWISTLNSNPNVIYVATEANLPIFKVAK